MLKINFLAVLLNTVLSLGLGFLWFAVLFKKPWGEEMNYSGEKPTPAVMMKSFGIFLIGSFFTALVFGYIMKISEFIAAFKVLPVGYEAFSVAFFIWLGFYLPQSLGRVSWEFKSWRLVLIHGSYDLVRMVMMAMIFWNWKVSAQ